MAANTSAIFPIKPIFGALNLTGTACATRAPVAVDAAAAAQIYALGPTVGATGRRVDRITVKNCPNATGGVNTASVVGIWVAANTTSGTMAYLVDEIAVAALTGSSTVASATATNRYTDFVIGSGAQMYASTSVAYASGTNNLCVYGFGGDYETA